MELTELRSQIDTIDDALIRLFCQRMEVASRIAQYKQQKGLPIYQPEREAQKLADAASKADAGLEEDVRQFFRCILSLSKQHQVRCSEVSK